MSGVEKRLLASCGRRPVAGAMVGVLERGQTEGAATGFADAAAGRALTTRTVTHVASLTKPVVAAAFVLAAPSSLDTPILELVPELRQGWRASPRLTARQLLSHTSGLHPDTKVASGEPLIAAVQAIVSRRQAQRPSRAWRYCNGGFWLAGLALARLRDQSFEDAVRDIVLKPATMSASGFERPSDAAVSHADGRPTPTEFIAARRPGSGLCSTVGDMLRFAEFVLQRQSLVDAMATPMAPTTSGSWYGLGWEIKEDLLWHRGSWAGYESCLLVAPGHKFAAVAMVNDKNGGALVKDLVGAELLAATGRRPPWKGMGRLKISARAWRRLAWAKATRFLP